MSINLICLIYVKRLLALPDLFIPGHSARAADAMGTVFVNDFGYGRVDEAEEKVCLSMIYQKDADRGVPILLSHWDTDHYRVALSNYAKWFSGTAYDVTKRPWVTPNRSHIVGPIANNQAWLIQQSNSLYQWPDTLDKVETQNIAVVRCNRNTRFNLPDKNNLGALALFVGRGDNIMLYPGDANFESIPNISSYDKKIRTVIATHHGSVRSLESGAGEQTGSHIPRASSGESYAVFSYSKGNKFGHDIDKAFPFYQKKGYSCYEATAELTGTEDTLEVGHFGDGWSTSNSMLMAVVDETQQKTTMSAPVDKSNSIHLPTSKIVVSSLPTPPLDWLRQAHELQLPPLELPNGYQRGFPEAITLHGSGDNQHNLDRDDLAAYAIRDADGDIAFYDIVASKIILDGGPLNVPCNTDYPVTVQITCQDIELVSRPQEETELLPLVRFNVRSGKPCDNPRAKLGGDCLPGDPGYVGGRLRLAVAGQWINFVNGSGVHFKGLSIQYCGGHGANGQDGSIFSGPGSLLGETFRIRGGDAGPPASIPADSEILCIAATWPQEWMTVALDFSQVGTESEFGKPGKAGKDNGNILNMFSTFPFHSYLQTYIPKLPISYLRLYACD